MGNPNIILTECPRDAMQGLSHFVPTEIKAAYINLLIQTGFDVIDFGSFVSPKAIPQMADTAEVLSRLDLSNSPSKLLAIIANLRGAQEAAQHEKITFLGYPFSISETFQQRNTNSSCAAAFDTVKAINELCDKQGKQLIVYLSMGFGNPYGDEWSNDIVLDWSGKLSEAGVSIMALSDTIGIATPEQISSLFPTLTHTFSTVEFGLHLHSTPATLEPKLAAAYQSGCKRFDGALKGFGGCPMAKDELTGNVATERLVNYLLKQKIPLQLNMGRLDEALAFSNKVYYQ
ncbi:hydroxymethylglutaryl-CoA lyase [Mucilaginibacter koreensis]